MAIWYEVRVKGLEEAKPRLFSEAELRVVAKFNEMNFNEWFELQKMMINFKEVRPTILDLVQVDHWVSACCEYAHSRGKSPTNSKKIIDGIRVDVERIKKGKYWYPTYEDYLDIMEENSHE